MNYLKILLLFMTLLHTIGCLVPSQLSKVTMTESFTQDFTFPGESDEEILDILGELLSPERVDQLRQIGRYKSLQDDIKEGNIISRGIATITFGLVPNRKRGSFYVKGTGSYIIMNKISNQVYFVADFFLIEEVHPIEQVLENEKLSIKFNQSMINHLPYQDGATWNHEPNGDINIDIIITTNIYNKKRKGKYEFRIDDTAKHKVSINGKSLGYIEFNPTNEIIDIKGVLKWVRRYGG